MTRHARPVGVAGAWASKNPDLLSALALPIGVGQPEWSPERLCGPVTFDGLQ